MKCTAHLALVAVLTMWTGNGRAQTSPTLDARSAQQIISTCVEHSTQKKQSHAIAVLDNSGALLAFLRMDGNPPGVGEFALQKASAAASWRFSTEQMAKSNEFLGAVGVSGESAQDDAACAIAGLKAAGFKDSRE